MHKNLEITNLQKLYISGDRDFRNSQLRRSDLRNTDLSNINLQGSDLSYADLRQTNLTGANLSHCYFNEANLTGANLTGADLTGSYFIKAYMGQVNCYKAILKDAYFSGSFLTKANLRKADLSGAFFGGSHLTGAIFQDALYSNETRFDAIIKPEKLGMIKASLTSASATQKKTIAELIAHFETIIEITQHYLGGTITMKNYEQSRPDIDWLDNFSINKQGKINYQGSLNNKATTLQVKWMEKWIKSFVKISSFIVRDLARIIEEKRLIL